MRFDETKNKQYDIIINDKKYAYLTNKHIYYPNSWIISISSENLQIDLDTSDENAAKMYAKDILKEFLFNKVAYYQKLIEGLEMLS